MNSTRISPLSWLAAIPLLLSGVAWAAQPLTVTNPGFELPVVAEGNYDNLPTAWNAYNSNNAFCYAYNPGTGDFAAQAPQGLNVGAVYWAINATEEGLTQTLATTFKAGDDYLLSVKVGYSAYFGSVPGYRVQLLVGDTVIAEDNNSLTVPSGQFVTSTVNYAYSPDHSALINQPLKIRLLSKGLTNYDNEVAFDDVQLSAVLANPYAAAGGPYYLPNPTVSLQLNASASLPSGTSNITLYEWDLNNDGLYDVTGVTPAAISFADLQTLYGMVDGSNAVNLRITDSSNKTATAQATVQLVTSTKYTGGSSNNDTWSVASNWDNGLPTGNLDVVILTEKIATAWSDATPYYKGNLTLQNNARLTIGWTAIYLGSYNALGTPGLSKIIMNPGSSIRLRTGGTPIIPEIQLLADASWSLGESTQAAASPRFNYPITGPFTLTVSSNGSGVNQTEFNAGNSFSALVLTGDSTNAGQPTYKGSVANSLGMGNVTINANPGNTKAPQLWIDAPYAIAPTATLYINGDGPTGNQTNRLRLGANITVAGLVLNGTPLAAGTYGSTTSAAANKLSWINTAGTGILTVAAPSVGYWDLNGAEAGAGSAPLSGTWDASNAFWNSNAEGTGSIAAWTAGRTAVFSAGSAATGAYAVDVVGTQDIGGLIIRNGPVTFTQGSGGGLLLTSDVNFSLAEGTSSIATPITQSSTRALSKSGAGTLVLSNSLSHTGGTTLHSGNMVLAGNNSAATGSTAVTSGVLRVDTPSSIPGTARNLTINSLGRLVFGPSFGSGNIQTALNGRVVASSAGIIAADNNPTANFDFSTAGFTAAYFGALSNVNYTGTLTPQGNAYRLTSDGGILTMANTNALTGARTLTARGSVVLAANNNYTGATTVEANSSLSLLGSTSTSGITVNAGTILTLGNNGSLGSGTLTLAAATTLKAIGTVVTTNPVAANTDFIIAGTGALTLGTTTLSNNRIITNTATSTATFGSIICDGSNNRSLTIGGSADTTVTGNLVLGTGTLTKNDGGTLTLKGTNTYTATTINSGTLRLEGSVSGAATTGIGFGRLQLGSAFNGGVASGDISMAQGSSVIEAVGADRSISNNIILNTNANNCVITGAYSLTVGGTLIHSGGNRTLINSISSGKALTLGSVNLSTDATSRILTIAGSGNTVISGVIANGGTSTAGALIKSGTGSLTLNGSNTYAGTTTVNANGGKLLINGSTGAGNVAIGSGTTLGGTGTIGGNTTLSANARLEFDIHSDVAGHDKLELAAGRALTFSGASVLTVTGTPDSDIYGNITYTLLTAPGGIIGTLPVLDMPSAWDAWLFKEGNDLKLTVYYTGVFPPAPTLLTIQNDQGGGPAYTHSPVTYTLTFSEDMDITTFSAADFGNEGIASITFGTIAETTPGVVTIQVTPSTEGTLCFRINQGTSLRSTAGVNLNTSAAILDDTTLQVEIPTMGVLAVSSGDVISSGYAGGPFSPVSIPYTLTNYGSNPLDWTISNTETWLTLSSTGGTLAAGENTTVIASINASAASLAIGPYYDTLTFNNTTTTIGNTTRGVSLTVKGQPVQVTLSNLNQTYDGTPKPVSVTTDPTPITYAVTYNGLAEVPVNAGFYEVVATITDPDYSGSATGTLLIAKAAQSITFAALASVGNDQAPLTLTATASSGLPVSYTSSNTSVATVSGNTVTIVGVGITTITASQSGNDYYQAAPNEQQDLSVSRAIPLAVPGGPYRVADPNLLVLDGSGSLPSSGGGATLTLYEWDLNSNDNGGVFNVSVTGANPAPISVATLINTWGMSTGAYNTIRLRVTDSAAKTSLLATTTVYIITPLVWDANAAAAGQTDGSGGWLTNNQWWNGSANVNWSSGLNAAFGKGGAGGDVMLPTPTSVGSITFNSFTGTYTLGTASQTLTINGGIDMTAASSAVTINSPIVLGAVQTWTNNSSSVLSLATSSPLNNGGYNLTINGSGPINLNRAIISGSGGFTKNGSGYLNLTGPAHSYTGTTTLNSGTTMVHNNMPPGNLTLNGGLVEYYWSDSMKRTLGSAAGQVQILGGASGFSSNGSGVTILFNNDSTTPIVWGSTYFNPSPLVLSVATSQAGGTLVFQNKIDLNGAARTIAAHKTSNLANGASISGVISNSNATPAGLIKTGVGFLALSGANTYNGGTTLQEGTLQVGNLNGLGSSIGTLTVNGGVLDLNNIAAVTVGNLSGVGGTIANNGAGAITFNIGSGGGTGGNFQGVIANNTNGSGGTLALTKTGLGSITLSGTNTYTGVTTISQGKLFINGSTAGGNVSVSADATLGGTGTIGGDTTIAANGKLEFNLGTPANSHDPLNMASGKTLAFSGASQLTITTSGEPLAGTYVLVTGGNITGSAPTLNLPPGWIATTSIVSNELLLNVTYVLDTTAPTLISITDDKAGGPVTIHTLVTYTVVFSEDMDASTVTAAAFGNAGSAAVTIAAVTETTPTSGIFTVQATPTTPGTLRLKVNAGATLADVAGNPLNTTAPIPDNTTLPVEIPPMGVLAVSSGNFISTGYPGGPFSPLSKQYTLTNYGSQPLDWTASNNAAWLTLSSNGGTLAAGENITVTASINASANSLAISPYYDTLTFHNTTNTFGNTTRGVSLTVLGQFVQVTLSNLNQTYDGTPKPASVTTNPTPIAYTVTYNGSATVPTNAGSYEVVATIIETNYSGSATGTLLIAKASQSINFAALAPVGNDQATLTLTATASSSLPVAYTSSHTNVATVAGNTVTIVGIGTTTITASQDGNQNYQAATNVQQNLSVVRAIPLAVPGGPYTVPSPGGSLALNGSGSLPSAGGGTTITLYEWDLNSNDNGGVFNVSVTGANPSPISVATLMSTWGMSIETNNTIRLRVTDSAAKTSLLASTTVYITPPLVWDANNTIAGLTDGGGGWLTNNQWWNGSANVNWTSGSNAAFGKGSAGGAVTLSAPISVSSITFNSFTGTYTLGTAGQTLTINGGIEMTAASGVAAISSPMVLGAAQTWINNSSSALTLASTLDNSGFQLTVDGTGTIAFSSNFIGSGGITKNGTGRFNFPNSVLSYTGQTTINGGVLFAGDTPDTYLGSGNLTLNGGVFEWRWGGAFTRSLGTGNNQVRILGGVSGFSLNGSTGATITLYNDAATEVVWGAANEAGNGLSTGYFNPSILALQTTTSQGGSGLTFANKMDFNGTTRTISTSKGVTGAATATLSGVIRTSSGTAGLTKTGDGTLILSAANTYNGPTTITAGTLDATTFAAINTNSSIGKGSAAGSAADLVINGGTLRHSAGNVATTNRLFSIGTSGGTIDSSNANATNTLSFTGTGAMGFNSQLGARTLTLGGSNTGNNTMAVLIANDGSGNATSVTKSGAGLWILSGTNSYTGPTTLSAGTLSIGASNNLGGAASNLVFNGGSLQITGTTITSLAGLGHTVSFTSGQTVVLDINNAANVFTAGQVLNQGSGGLVKAGAGTLVINSANTYTGSTTVSAGVLRFDDSGAIASTLMNLAGGTLAVNRSTTTTLGTNIPSYIAGTGSLNNVGAGTLVINAPTYHTGNTSATVGNITLSHARAIQNSALNTTGAGFVTLSGVTTPIFGGLANSGTIRDLSTVITSGYGSVTNLTLNPQTGLTYTYGGVIANGASGMTLTKTGVGTQTLTGANTYSGATTINQGTLNLGGSTATGSLASTVLNLGGGTFSYTRTGTNTQTFTTTNVTPGASTVSNSVATNTLALGSLAGRSVGGTVNFSNFGTITTSTSVSNGIIGGWATTNSDNWATKTGSNITALGSYTVTTNVAADYLNNNMDVGVANTVVGVINTNSLRFAGAGVKTLTLAAGDNIIQSGGILVRSDVGSNLQTITGGNLLGSASGDLIIHQYNTSNGLTIASLIKNNGSATALTKSGSGLLTLTNNNTFTGGIFLNAGTLKPTVAQSFTGGITLNGGSFGDNNANGNPTIYATAVNGNAITVNGPAALVVDGTLPTTSTIAINPNAVLKLGASASALIVQGVVSGTGVLDVNANNYNSNYSVSLTNTANTFSGDVTYTASNGSNTLSVASIADSGKVQVGLAVNNGTKTFALDSLAIAPLTFNTRQFELNGPSGGFNLAIANNSSQAFNINTDLLVTGTGTRTLTLQGTGAGLSTFAGVISNGGLTSLALNKAGAGKWSLSGANTFTGAVTVSGGTLVLTGLNNYTGQTTINSSALVVNTIKDFGVASSLGAPLTGDILFERYGNNSLTYIGTGDTSNRTFKFTPYKISDAANGAIYNNGTGPLIFNASTFNTYNTTTPRRFNLTLGGTYTGSANEIQGVLQDAASGGSDPLYIHKVDSCTWLLNGVNTYTGATAVNNGILGGSGRLSGSGVTLAAAGSLAPGASVGTAGTLTITGGLTLTNQVNGGAGKLLFDLGAPGSSDKITVGGTLTIGTAYLGFSDFVFTGLTGLQNGTYTLITSGGISGTLAASGLSGPVGVGGTGTLQLNGNNIELFVTGLSTGDTTPPTLTSITDDKAGSPVIVNTLVTYTLTFSEDMDATTVTADDFGNAGSSAVTIGSVTETTPTSGVFTVQATPTTTGTLILKVNAGAVLKDVAGNNLVTTTAIPDNTTITVQSVYNYWSNGAAFTADSNNDGVKNALAWVFGAANKDINAISLLPTFDNTSDPLYFIYTYRRSDSAAANSTIKVEYGSTLSGWTSAVHDGTNIIITTSDNFYSANPGTDKVEVKIKKTLAVGSKLFTRLNVVVP